MNKCVVCNRPVEKAGYKDFTDKNGHRLCLCFDCCLQIDIYNQLNPEELKNDIKHEFCEIINAIDDEQAIDKAKDILSYYKICFN